MRRITFKGTGQLNGAVPISKTIELDDKTASSLSGPNKNDVIKAILAIHYPGVRIDPSKIGYESIYFNEKSNIGKSSLDKRDSSVKQNKKSSFSVFTVLFFPVKLAWWLVKWLLKEMWKSDKY